MSDLKLEVEVVDYDQAKADKNLEDHGDQFKDKIVDGRGTPIGRQTFVKVKED